MMEQVATNQNTRQTSAIDIERQQEELLKSKYPAAGVKVGSAILQKRLQGKVKYFDSGDYNMALSKKLAAARGHSQATEGDAHATSGPPNKPTGGLQTSNSPLTSSMAADPDNVHNVHTPSLGVMAVATAPIAQEILMQHQVSQAGSEGNEENKSMSAVECTGDTMATPENVPAVARKKSILQASTSAGGMAATSKSMYDMRRVPAAESTASTDSSMAL